MITFFVIFIFAERRCVARWERLVDTSVMNGIKVPARSLPACQNQCINNPNCTGVDWDPSADETMQCTMHGPWSGSQMNQAGVSHYRVERPQQDNCSPGKS